MSLRAFGVARRSFSGIGTGEPRGTGRCVRTGEGPLCLPGCGAAGWGTGREWKGACPCAWARVCGHSCVREHISST